MGNEKRTLRAQPQLKNLSLCYLRVSTWASFRLQFYYNGHSALAAALSRHHIEFELAGNAFLFIANFDRANLLVKRVDIRKLHRQLDRFAEHYCPIIKSLPLDYHGSIMQAEYATDIIFKRQQDLQAIYPHLLETLIHSIKPENIASLRP